MRTHFIDAGVCLIEISANDIDGFHFGSSSALVCDELPVAAASKIVLRAHDGTFYTLTRPFNFIATY
jgi:hypothetical protein